MSLFLSREWWSIQGEDAEEEVEDALRSTFVEVASFPKAFKTSADVIVMGTLGGILKIYEVVRMDEDGTRTSGPDNLLLEKQMDDPIIDIAIGKLTSSGDSDPKIGLLHPRKVGVYAVQRDKSNHNYTLTLQYQHNLSRSAHSLIIGQFGGSKKDIICVQSIDGSINIFEQESFAFSRFLPGFLLPGPIVYTERTDSFITITSSLQLESYRDFSDSSWCEEIHGLPHVNYLSRYQALAVAEDNSNYNGNTMKTDNITSGRKIVPDWVIGLGEATQALEMIRSDKKDIPSTVIVLGERSLAAILDTGFVIFMKSLDYTPMCMHCFKLDDLLCTLVATDTNTLLVYHNTTLKWASKLPFAPMKLARGSFQRGKTGEELLKNLVVLASEVGEVCVTYMGTNPAVFSPAPPKKRELNYEATDQEYKALTEQIKTMQSHSEPSKGPNDMTVALEVQKNLDRCYHETMVKTTEGIPMAKIVAHLRASTPLSKVRVTFSVQKPLHMLSPTSFIPSLTDTENVECYVYLYNSYIPHSLEVQVSVVYFNSTDVPKVITTTIQLPLKLVVQPCPPIKDADFKVTISTNKSAVSLVDLFSEFVLESNMANAVGFQYYGGPFVTVLSSKTSQRYRLQSDNLPSLWLVSHEIETRLKSFHKSDLQCSYNASLPMHEYFSEIEALFHRRSKQAALVSELGNRSAQFRAIERRLLSRFKDKNPTPLTNLDTLLEGTNRQIIMATEAVEDCQKEIEQSSANLSSITKLLLMLARLSTGLTVDDEAKLATALSAIVQWDQDQGWHETTDAALTFLLRTSLAKAGKENQGATPITLDMPKDTARLKKHVTTVLDRIAKGGRIEDSKNVIEATQMAEFQKNNGPEDDTWSQIGEATDELIGSQFGEAGERLRSARARGVSAQASRAHHGTSAPLSELEEAEQKEVDDSIPNEDGPEIDDEEPPPEDQPPESSPKDQPQEPVDEYDIGW